MFHAELQNDHAAIKKEEENYIPLLLVADVTEQDIQENYKSIKRDIERLLVSELEKLTVNNPEESSFKANENDNEEPQQAVSM